MTEEKAVSSPMEKMRLRTAAEGYSTLSPDYEGADPGRNHHHCLYSGWRVIDLSLLLMRPLMTCVCMFTQMYRQMVLLLYTAGQLKLKDMIYLHLPPIILRKN